MARACCFTGLGSAFAKAIRRRKAMADGSADKSKAKHHEGQDPPYTFLRNEPTDFFVKNCSMPLVCNELR
jgi:hypothetical protein